MVQEPEFMARALWEGMAIMRPWDEIPAEVLAMEPQIVPNEATKDGTLNDEQKEILQVGRKWFKQSLYWCFLIFTCEAALPLISGARSVCMSAFLFL